MNIVGGIFLAGLGVGMVYFVVIDDPNGFMRYFCGLIGVALTLGGVAAILSARNS